MKKKDNTQGMKILCYFAIVFCFLLILTPPLLNTFYPRPPEVKIDENKYAQLNCHTNDNGEIIVISYVGEDYQIGQIKYTFTTIAENWHANALKTDLERSVNLIKRVEESDTDDERMIYLLSPLGEVKKLDENDLALLSPDIKQQPQDQKAYYEAQEFTCSVSIL